MECLSSCDPKVLERELSNHHRVYDLPVKSELAENIFAKYVASGHPSKVVWRSGSHAPGSDVFIKDKLRSIGYSIKSAKEPQNGMWLHISSYRTTKHKTLEDKKQRIREIESVIAGYAVFARTESTRKSVCNVHYKVYLIAPELLNIDTFTIRATENGNYKGINSHGVKLSITQNMSAQLWFDVPMGLINGPLITKLCEVGPFEMRLWY